MLEKLQQRELSIGELFGMGFQILKMNLRSILCICIVFFVPILIALNLVAERAVSILDSVNTSLAVGSTTNMHLLGQAWIYIAVLLLISLCVLPIGDIALALITKRTLQNEEVKTGKVLLDAFEKGPSIILAGIVYTLCVGMCFLLIIPGIYLWITWYFYTMAIAVDDKPALESLFYSQKLVKGRWWSTFGVLFLIGLVLQLFGMALLALCTLGGDSVFGFMVYYVVMNGINIFMILFFTLYYYNRRFLVDGNTMPNNQNVQ